MYKAKSLFKGKPFGLNPDPKYFFNSESHKRAISTLGYGLGQGQGFIVITGDSGSGKTMLTHALQHLLDRTDIVAGRIQNTQLQALDTLRYVAAEFDLEYEDCSKVALVKNLEGFFDQLREEKKRAVLIIDEAQNLDETAFHELRMLGNLISGNENLIQIVLLGTRGLNEKLYRDEFDFVRRRIVATCHLHRMSESETSAYIKHRLRTAGWLGEPVWTDEALVAIFEYSDGLPSQVNLLCGRLVMAAEIEQLDQIDENLVHDLVQEINEQFSDHVYQGSLVENVIGVLAKEKRALKQQREALDQEESVPVIPVSEKSEENQVEEVIAEPVTDELSENSDLQEPTPATDDHAAEINDLTDQEELSQAIDEDVQEDQSEEIAQTNELEITTEAVEETIIEAPELQEDAVKLDELSLDFEKTETTLDNLPDLSVAEVHNQEEDENIEIGLDSGIDEIGGGSNDSADLDLQALLTPDENAHEEEHIELDLSGQFFEEAPLNINSTLASVDPDWSEAEEITLEVDETDLNATEALGEEEDEQFEAGILKALEEVDEESLPLVVEETAEHEIPVMTEQLDLNSEDKSDQYHASPEEMDSEVRQWLQGKQASDSEPSEDKDTSGESSLEDTLSS